MTPSSQESEKSEDDEKDASIERLTKQLSLLEKQLQDAGIDEKDATIDRLTIQLSTLEKQLHDAKEDIHILNEELYREKTINNRLLGISSSATSPIGKSISRTSSLSTGNTSSQSQEQDGISSQSQTLDDSLLLTAAQRSPHNSSADTEPEETTDGRTSQQNTNWSEEVDLSNPLDARQHDTNWSEKTSESEDRRIRRARGMLFGLRHTPATVSTLIIVDSNGRGIQGKDIDGSGDNVCFRSIGGLCIPALTAALHTYHGKVKRTMDNIKTLSFALGTNDELHKREHKDDMATYVKGLDVIARKVFPFAKISFSLPFSSIRGLGINYVDGLRNSIKEADVGWIIHRTPSMQNKLVGHQQIHLNQSGRWAYIKWLQKLFGSCQPIAGEESKPQAHQHQQPIARDSHSNTSPSYSDVLHSQRSRNNSEHTPNSLSRDSPGLSDDHDAIKQSLYSAPFESILKDRILEFLLQRMDGPPSARNASPWRSY